MIVLYMAVFFSYVFLWITSSGIPSSCGKLNLFEKMGFYIYKKLYEKDLLGGKDISIGLRSLHPELGMGKRIEESLLQEYYIKKISTVLLIFFIGNLLAFFVYISAFMDSRLSDSFLVQRNTYEKGDKEENLIAEMEYSGEKRKEEFTLLLKEQQYEDRLLEEMADEVKKILPQEILGGNISLDEVSNSLNLVKKIEGYPFTLNWKSDQYLLIDSEGRINHDELEKGGEYVNLTVSLLYGDFSQTVEIPVYVVPPVYTKEQLLRQNIQRILSELEKGDRTERQMELPSEVDGNTISWSRKKEDSSSVLFFLAAAASLLIYLSGDRDLQKEVKKRNMQMLSDYPQLVTKFILYMGAGITMRNTFKKIAGDYQLKKKKGGRKRYVYEEMILTCYELERGISETVAYENFGKRCHLPQYNKFVNLLSQNLKKGSGRIIDDLHKESETAFEERRNLAKKLGEEAGTKLLLPMMMMLGIVMILIMMPAYFSFGF